MSSNNFNEIRHVGLVEWWRIAKFDKILHVSKGWPICDGWIFRFGSKQDAWKFYKYRGYIGD